MRKQEIVELLNNHNKKFNYMSNAVVSELVDYLKDIIKWWHEEVSLEDFLSANIGVKRFLVYKNWDWDDIVWFYENNMVDIEDIVLSVSSMEEIWKEMLREKSNHAYAAIECTVRKSIEYVLDALVYEMKK